MPGHQTQYYFAPGGLGIMIAMNGNVPPGKAGQTATNDLLAVGTAILDQKDWGTSDLFASQYKMASLSGPSTAGSPWKIPQEFAPNIVFDMNRYAMRRRVSKQTLERRRPSGPIKSLLQ